MNMDPNIVYSDFPETETSSGENMARFFFCSKNRLQDTFMICSPTGLRYTRGEVLEQGKNFSRSLCQNSNFGLLKGDIIGILLPNCGEYFSIVLGLVRRGMIPSCFNPSLTIDEITDLVQEVGAKALICLPSATQGLENLLKISSVKQLILVGQVPTEGSTFDRAGNISARNYFDLIQEGKSLPEVDPADQDYIGQGDDTAMIFWSSGTSGRPKGVELTHNNLIGAVMAYTLMFGWDPSDIILHSLPFFHIYGFTCMLMAVFNQGCTEVTMQKFSPQLFINALQDHRPTILGLVPPLVAFLASSDKLTEEDFTSVKLVVCGGAPCGNTLIDTFHYKSGGHISFIEGYGLTESNGLGFLVPKNINELSRGSVGKVSSGVEAKVTDLATGKSVGAGVPGEICLRSRTVMKGFYKKPEATSLMIDQEGWLHTGDLGYFTAEHKLFYISGRIKDIIKVKGFQVSPEEIEDVLRKLHGVKDVAVAGVPHPSDGEVPKAFVVRQNSDLTPEVINTFLKDKLAYYKQLKGGIKFLEMIPRSASGKILRRLLLQ